MMKKSFAALVAALACVAASSAHAAGVPLTQSMLGGFVPGTDATAAWAVDLGGSGLPFISQITIRDDSQMQGGSTGAYSGFDLDFVRIGNGLAANAASIPASSVAIVLGDAMFNEGTQRPPSAPLLFGTSAANTINNTVATVLTADATLVPFDGFLSMGDAGELILNFNTPFNPAGKYLYVGEVTGNGERFVAEAVPEPATYLLASLAGIGLFVMRRRQR